LDNPCGLQRAAPKNRFGAERLEWKENKEPKNEAVKLILPLEVENF
jgi:hypothetical protein